MDKRIIYQNGTGVSVIIPATDCGLTLNQIAVKDVPTGEPFWIVDASEIPADRTERGKWAIDTDEAGTPDGYGG
jgi:hypothetical protein